MTSNTCMNSKCQKNITHPNICKGCETQVYCSMECKTDDFVNHSKNCQQIVKSSLAKTGKFLTDEEIGSKPVLKITDFECVILPGHISAKLGQGSYGEVLLMKHKGKEQLFAVKSMIKAEIVHKDVYKFILNEIKIQPKIVHENIIRIYASFEDAKTHYLVMEYASRGNLYHIIRQSKGLSEPDAFYFFIQACNAVYFLHSHRLIHRDIKPENLVLFDDGVLKLCDLGWLTPFDETVKSCVGTLEYMAPELVTEKPYDYTVDLWSLGILLYELIHGYSPFAGKNNTAVMQNILSGRFTIRRPCSDNLKSMIFALLKMTPSTRIKWNQIFNHPWIKSFEEQYTQRRSSAHDNKDLSLQSVNEEVGDKEHIEVPETRKNQLLDFGASPPAKEAKQEDVSQATKVQEIKSSTPVKEEKKEELVIQKSEKKLKYTSNSELLLKINKDEEITIIRELLEDAAKEYFSLSMAEPGISIDSYKYDISDSVRVVKKKVSKLFTDEKSRLYKMAQPMHPTHHDPPSPFQPDNDYANRIQRLNASIATLVKKSKENYNSQSSRFNYSGSDIQVVQQSTG
jgi:serine/threonine protein kinase